MRHLVVLNPAAHGGRAGSLQSELAAAFAAEGLHATFMQTRAPGEGTTLVAGQDPGAFDVVVAAGGDGTLFEVVNGLMALAPDQRPALGLLPLGTGNAFARDLGLEPGDWQGAMKQLVADHRRRVDVGEAEGEGGTFWFINMLGLGFVEDAARQAKRLKWLGRSAYTLGALVRLVSMPAYDLEVMLDGKPLGPSEVEGAPTSEALFFLEVANSRYTGTRFLMAPHARIDDGLFDVVVVRRLSLARALRLFPTIYNGRHLAEPEVEVYRARELRISASAGRRGVIVDGEFQGSLPLALRCRPGALEVIAAQ